MLNGCAPLYWMMTNSGMACGCDDGCDQWHPMENFVHDFGFLPNPPYTKYHKLFKRTGAELLGEGRREFGMYTRDDPPSMLLCQQITRRNTRAYSENSRNRVPQDAPKQVRLSAHRFVTERSRNARETGVVVLLLKPVDGQARLWSVAARATRLAKQT
jgi:hypothetical protein